MFGWTFHHDTTKKYIILFGTMFNDLIVQRFDAEGNETHVKVPINHAPRDVMIEQFQQEVNPMEEPRKVALTLPRVSFATTGFKYDGERKLNILEARVVRKDPNNADKYKNVYAPVPYDVEITLWVYTKNDEDGIKIVEQILPSFQPEWNATLHLIPELEIAQDIAITLDDVKRDDNFAQGDLSKRRINIWTLTFTLKGYFYGPVRDDPMVKFVNTNFYFGENPDDPQLSSRVGFVNVQPGLDANGNPTTNPNNTINAHSIFVDDNWDDIVIKSGIVIEE